MWLFAFLLASNDAAFAAWLTAHPEVESVSSDTLDDGLREFHVSDANGSLLCAVGAGGTRCAHLPERARFSALRSSFRDAQGRRHYQIGLADSQVTVELALGTWRRDGSPLTSAVSPFDWATLGTLRIFPSREALALDLGDGERFCIRRQSGWTCAPPVRRRSLSEAEPRAPEPDRRLPPPGDPPAREVTWRQLDDGRTQIFVERSWYLQRIAHTYFHEGRYLEVYSWKPGAPLSLLATLRTAHASNDHPRGYFDSSMDGRLKALSWRWRSASCLELVAKGAHPSPLLAPGHYCITDQGACRVSCAASVPSDRGSPPCCPPIEVCRCAP